MKYGVMLAVMLAANNEILSLVILCFMSALFMTDVLKARFEK